MVEFYFKEETHTLASCLRPILEKKHPGEFVACTHSHPLDTFITVSASSEASVREALLQIIDKIDTVRKSLAAFQARRE